MVDSVVLSVDATVVVSSSVVDEVMSLKLFLVLCLQMLLMIQYCLSSNQNYYFELLLGLLL